MSKTAFAIIAAIVTGAAFTRAQSRAGSTPLPAPATAEYGRRLLASTSILLGPDQSDPAMRYTGNRLQCGSCHLNAGAAPYVLYVTFPRVPAGGSARIDEPDPGTCPGL